MYPDKKNDQQPGQKPDRREYHINLNEYAGDEDDYNIATEQATTYCQDCERAIGADQTATSKDSVER